MKPLQHLTILDLSRVLACPFASMILAELARQGRTLNAEEAERRGLVARLVPAHQLASGEWLGKQ